MSCVRYSSESIQRAVARIVLSTRDAVFTVNVNWNGDNRQWNFNCYSLGDNRWNEGNRAFSRNSIFLPHLRGSFCFQSLLPTTEHPSHFLQVFRKQDVFLVVKQFQFPTDTQKELECVHLFHGKYECAQFFFLALIACNKQ